MSRIIFFNFLKKDGGLNQDKVLKIGILFFLKIEVVIYKHSILVFKI
mgnify:CR=1 FL=1